MKRTNIYLGVFTLILVAALAVILILKLSVPAREQSAGRQSESLRQPKTGQEAAPEEEAVSQPKTGAPIYLTTMTHMEKSFEDDTSEVAFENHVAELRFGMDLADEYGAKLTVESEQSFARANEIWGLNVMREIVDRGHGVGTHCDFGFRDAATTPQKYAKFFEENKALVDALVGADNNRGCSGGGGESDWVQAATIAGFDYIDGFVGMHLLAVPMSARPDATWTNETIRETYFHYNVPLDPEWHFYPFMLKNTLDMEPDEDGTIVVLSGDLGRLDTAAEEAGGGDYVCKKADKCPITQEDVDAIVADIMDAHANHDGTKIGKINVYLPANLFTAENEAGLRLFFSKMRELEEQGIVTWATIGDVYDAYVAWN